MKRLLSLFPLSAIDQEELKDCLVLRLIVVDYIQLMRSSGKKEYGDRVQEISEITQGLKASSKRTRCTCSCFISTFSSS